MYNYGMIKSNKCNHYNAGGINIENQCDNIEFQDLKISENYSAKNGGGLNLYNIESFKGTNLSIYKNLAYEKGSGIFIENFKDNIII